MVGKPITNCESLGNESSPVTSTAGGDFTVGESWRTTLTLGFNLGDLKIEASETWKHSTTQTFSQSIAITVDPGQQGVLVANVIYKQTNGTVVLPSGDTIFALSNQPSGVVSYEPIIIACSAQFPANASETYSCSGSAPALQRPPIFACTWVAALVAVVATVLV